MRLTLLLLLMLLLPATASHAEPIPFSMQTTINGNVYDSNQGFPTFLDTETLVFTAALLPGAWPQNDDVLSVDKRVTFATGVLGQQYAVTMTPSEGPFTLVPGQPVSFAFATLTRYAHVIPSPTKQYIQVFMEVFVHFASGDTIYGSTPTTWNIEETPRVIPPAPVAEPAPFALAIIAGAALLLQRRRRLGGV